MTTVNIDREKVTRMVTKTLMEFHDSGAHPGEVVIALAESLGRVIAAVGDATGNEILQRELLDVAIKQMTGAIIAARGDYASVVHTEH